MLTASRGSADAGRALLGMLARCGEGAEHDLGLAVVGAQYLRAAGEGLLEQRDGPAYFLILGGPAALVYQVLDANEVRGADEPRVPGPAQ